MNQVAPLSLNVPLSHDFLRLVTGFAEESAKAFGLATSEALKLTLAAEEIFTHICQSAKADDAIGIEAVSGCYYALLRFIFKAPDFDPRTFNLTARVSLDDESGLKEMGLLIASRAVDRFYITESPQQKLELGLVKEKAYPEGTDLEVPRMKEIRNVDVRSPDPDGLKLFARLAAAYYPTHFCLPSFRFPGKVVDMVASGEYEATVASGDHGEISAGVLWHWVGKRLVEFFGPYLFSQGDSGMAQRIMESCLTRIAKTEAIGLMSRCSTPELPRGYFESLGTIDLFDPDGTSRPWSIFYRQLQEDLGCQVWSHPDLEAFLRTEYGRLFFAREILLTRHEGEVRPPHSVFSVQFDRSHYQATLRAIWDGEDMTDNLSQHVKVLTAESLPNIFFAIDLSKAWQAALTPSLLQNGFLPKILLPYAGEGDVVVFQYGGGK